MVYMKANRGFTFYLPFPHHQDGGVCYCGDTFGKHGGAPEPVCNVACSTGYGHENCGGKSQNAIYNTEKRMLSYCSAKNKCTKLPFWTRVINIVALHITSICVKIA